MRSQIRLADRQGLLQGRHISPVQTKALIVLNYLDDIERHKQSDLALRRAFLSSGLADPAKLFPDELGGAKKKSEEVPDSDDVHYDYSGVNWKSGGEAIAEYEQLMRKIGAVQSGTLTGDMLTEPEWTNWG
jgi:hypothetical protein